MTEFTAQIDKIHFTYQWTGIDLLLSAASQLLLIFIAYRLDRSTVSHLTLSSYGVLLGALVGTLLYFQFPKHADEAGLHPLIFYYGLLPPIILEAGFKMKKIGFFMNFIIILSLAVLGTLFTAYIIGEIILWCSSIFPSIIHLSPIEAYLFGSALSATDTVATLAVFKKFDVPPLLYHVIFGESMMNDGVSIAMFNLLRSLLSKHLPHYFTDNNEIQTLLYIIYKVILILLGSILSASLVSLTSGYVLKKYMRSSTSTDDIETLSIAADLPSETENESTTATSTSPIYEISFILLTAYCSYFVAELLSLSGIVSLFFSGILMSHYHFYTVSLSSRACLDNLLGTLSFLAENFVFLYLGVSAVANSQFLVWDWNFIFVVLIATLVGRAVSVFPICIIANIFYDRKKNVGYNGRGIRKRKHIPFSYMVAIWFAGLKGAIAFSLALNAGLSNDTHQKVIESTTLFIVIFTTLIQGSATLPLLRRLKLIGPPDEKRVGDNDVYHKLTNEHESKQEEYKDTWIHTTWEIIDETYMKPLFGGRRRQHPVPNRAVYDEIDSN